MGRTLRTTVRLAEGGRIVIPAEVRKRLGLDVGAEVIMTVKDDEAVLIGAKAARRKAQQWVRRHAKPGVSLSKELMAERKQEARRE
jgi:AbrB family looped-hinge helix DNA binding protein